MTDTIPSLKFDEASAREAWEEWDCNCGPAALAAIAGITLDEVHAAVKQVGFDTRHYMSPTMMEAAIPLSGIRLARKKCIGIRSKRDFPQHGLARIQWCGPWTAPGSNPKWAYRQTHWVASWRMEGWSFTVIFDVNGGRLSLLSWEKEIVPIIVASIKRADGDWFITHSWEIERL